MANWFEETFNNIVNTGDKAWEDITGETNYKQAQKKGKQQRAQDKIDEMNFKKFTDQDLLNPDAALYTPSYMRSPKLQKEQESMLSLFNARKDEILAKRAIPGISQTRF